MWANPAITVQAHPSRIARVLLYAIVLAVCWSPRIRLDFLARETVDLRLQDLLIVIALAYLFGSATAPVRARWDLVWGRWLLAFLYVALLTSTVHMAIAQPVSDLIRVAYIGRAIEVFVLAIVICALYLRANVHYRDLGRILRVGVWANLIWIGIQAVVGVRETLFGEVGDLIGSYGPKLIGEPSAFGSGFFLTFATALTVADYRTRTVSLPVTLTTFAAVLPAAYLVESRVNLFIILGMMIFFARRQVRTLIGPVAVTLVSITAIIAFIVWGDHLAGRLSGEGLIRGFAVRFDIWRLMGEYAGDWAAIGIGPGGLAAPELAWDEAHNIIVRAWLDYGIIGGVLLLLVLGMIARAAMRASRPHRANGMRWAGIFAGLTLLGVVIAGMVQDSLIAVTSTHLLMLTVGILAAETSKDEAEIQHEEPVNRPGFDAAAV